MLRSSKLTKIGLGLIADLNTKLNLKRFIWIQTGIRLGTVKSATRCFKPELEIISLENQTTQRIGGHWSEFGIAHFIGNLFLMGTFTLSISIRNLQNAFIDHSAGCWKWNCNKFVGFRIHQLENCVADTELN